MDLGKKIETLRKSKGLTQEGLAYRVGVSRQSVFKWECGESVPTIDKLKELAKLFEVSIDYLLDESKTNNDVNDSENVSNTSTKTYRNVFVSDSKLDFDGDVAIQNGFITGSKTKDIVMESRFDELNNKMLKIYNYERSIRFCNDSNSRILIDTKNNTFAVYSELAEQFVCPFENLISITLTDGGPRTVIGSHNVSGAVVGLNGGGGIIAGSGTSFSKGLSAIYNICFTYHDKNGEVRSYTFKITAYRNYLLYTREYSEMSVYNFYIDGVCSEIKNNLIKIKAELEAIVSDSKLRKDLGEVSVGYLKSLCTNSAQEFDAPKAMVRANRKSEDRFVNILVILELIVLPIVLIIVGIILTSVGFGTHVKDTITEVMLKVMGPCLLVCGGIGIIYGLYKYRSIR